LRKYIKYLILIILAILSVKCLLKDKETVEWNNLKLKGQFTDYLKFAFENRQGVHFDGACAVLSDYVC